MRGNRVAISIADPLSLDKTPVLTGHPTPEVGFSPTSGFLEIGHGFDARPTAWASAAAHP